MDTTANRYSRGKIYKIYCNITGLTYYGSTCEPILAKRLAQHKSHYKRWLNKKFDFITSFKVLENNNYDISLVELYPCNSKDELHKRERFYIENNECVNKFIPTQTDKEWQEKNKEFLKEYKSKWYNKKREFINEKRKINTICDCGGHYKFGDKSKHFKSQKHINYLQNI